MNTAGSDYDVVILGAGLIGLALAVALARQGLGVALLERSSLTAFEGAAVSFFEHAAPLFEEEGNAGGGALVADVGNPGFLEGPAPGADSW